MDNDPTRSSFKSRDKSRSSVKAMNSADSFQSSEVAKALKPEKQPKLIHHTFKDTKLKSNINTLENPGTQPKGSSRKQPPPRLTGSRLLDTFLFGGSSGACSQPAGQIPYETPYGVT